MPNYKNDHLVKAKLIVIIVYVNSICKFLLLIKKHPKLTIKTIIWNIFQLRFWKLITFSTYFFMLY